MGRVGFIQSELDLKMLVLYIMARVAAPITFLQLLELALCDGGVDYFSLTEAVGHMVETGQLTLEEERYSITEKGRRNSQACQSSLPFSVRRRCDANVAAMNDTLRREQQIKGRVEENPDGTALTHLHLADDAGVMLELSLLVQDTEQGERLIRRFKERPEQTYHQILALLEGRE